MPEPITPERLAEIQDRTHNATPGPWGVGNRTEIALDAKQDGPGCFSYTVKLATVTEDEDRQDDVYYLNPTTQPRAVASAEDDALFIAHARQDVEDLLAEVDRLNAQTVTYDRLDRAAIGDWEREVARLKEVAHNQARMISEITSACMAAELERDARLTAEDVERFLKRERDEYEPGGECWNTVDDVLDCFRLHMVTGTPLTEPRPEEGPSDPSVGRPPLTEAEELRAEVERLNAAVELLGGQLQGGAQAARDLARVIDVVALEIRRAVRLANAGDHVAAMRVITEWASEADWLDNLDGDDEGGESHG